MTEPAATPPTPPAPAPTPAAAPAGVALIGYEDFAKVELRVAEILEARPHPNADKLMLLQLNVGDAQKQIVAGIRAHYTPESLVGKKIIIVNNLAPAVLRGETSNGMLLAATSGQKVILLTVDDPECIPGAKIK